MDKYYISCISIKEFKYAVTMLKYYNFKLNNCHFIRNGTNVFEVNIGTKEANCIQSLSDKRITDFSLTNDVEDLILKRQVQETSVS